MGGKSQGRLTLAEEHGEGVLLPLHRGEFLPQMLPEADQPAERAGQFDVRAAVVAQRDLEQRAQRADLKDTKSEVIRSIWCAGSALHHNPW